MTDVERIAEYLNEQECGNPWTVNDVARRIKDPSTQCHDLARLLADVRREEREACIAAIEAEQREWAGDHPRSALDCARERIGNRGAQ